ncbi:ArsR/SmtB family transcription factor [Pseudonocardia humida]|uniref:Winged helix-turn-helix transcriptional regulator n=1 Tax=Pseudonocardia humida TaxID=2800819 RepID=A0ABT1A9A4_9PSEU|nr:winged helix-turn-helix domain-containing protein [Pseudonocardia humida]MCO1659508.1 winged helix-turn-helix transcriptional regulator [Pseudonocardia humida]
MSAAPGRRPATEAEIAALASSVRLRIIRMTRAEPLTNARIAELLGRDPATTLHHVRKLVRHGFLEPLPARRGTRGAKEIPYRSTGLSWRLEGAGADPVLAEAVLRAYLDEVTEVGVTALEQTRLVVQLRPTEVQSLRAELDAVVQRYAALPVDAGAEPVAIYLSVYPGGNRTDSDGVDMGA